MFWGKKEARQFKTGDTVRVMHEGNFGIENLEWTIGKEITLESVTRLFDKKSNCIYATTFKRDGKPETVVFDKADWKLFQAKLGKTR